MSWNIAKPGDQINGPVAVTGNLNVDSNTLFVDSANNRVGVLTASPTVPLDVVGDAKVSGNLAAANHDWTSQFVAPTVGFLAASNDSSAWIRIATYNSNPTHDPYLNFLTAGGQNWSIGIDNSDSDKLKVAMASSFNGTNEFLTIASNGVCTWSNVGGVAGTAMTLNGTGLGVGVSPSHKLHVVGTAANLVRFQSTAASGPYVLFENSSAIFGDVGSQLAISGTGSASNMFINARSTGSLMLATGDTARLTVDSSGNVGIANSSPTNKLTIAAQHSSGLNIAYDAAGAARTGLFAWTYGSSSAAIGGGVEYTAQDTFTARSTLASFLQFSFGDCTWFGNSGLTSGNTFSPSQLMVLKASGNLGLGVTPSAWASGWKALDVGGSSSMVWPNNNSALYLLANSYYNGTNWLYKQTAQAGLYLMVSGQHQWHVAPSGTAGTAITFTQALTLDASGRLSVGGSPTGTAKFEIQGTTVGERILFSQTANNTAARTMFSIGYRSGGTNPTGYNAIVCATETQFDDSYGVKILSGPTAAVGIHLNRDGRVGIGMADSMLNRAQIQGAGQATTTVSDNGDGSALFLSDTGSSANNGGLLFLGSASANGQRPHVGIKSLLTDATANGTGDMAFLTRTTTGATTLTEKMRLLTNGNLVLGRTSPLFGSVSGRTTFTIDGSAGSIISWGYNGTVSTYIVADAAGTELGEARNQPVRFITNSTERLRIKSTGQVNFVGLASDPAGAAPGDVYYNTTTNKLKCYNGTTWNDLF